VHTAEEFGVEVPDGAYERMATAIDSESEWGELSDEDWFREAQRVARRESFFHWELEFPSVFFDADGEKREDAGFDAVIGNPPWVSNWELTENNEELVSVLESLYREVTSGHWDIFVPFCYQATTLTKDEGRHSFITPTSLGTEKYGTEIRKRFINNCNLHVLVHFGQSQIFEEVDRQYLIYVISPQRTDDKEVELVEFDNYTFSPTAEVPQSAFSEYSNYSLRPSLADKDIELKKKIDNSSVPAGRVCCVNVGVVAHSADESELEFKKNDVIHEETGEGYKRYIEGSNISRYLIDWEGKYIDYESKQEHFHRSKFPELFESEKIVVPRVSGAKNRIEACFDDCGYYNNDNVTNVVRWSEEILDKQAPKNFEPLNDTSNFDMVEISGVLNSRLMTYYFSQFLATGTLQGSYSSIYPEDIRKMPLHSRLRGEDDVLNKLKGNVEEILEIRRERADLNLSLLDHLGVSEDDELDGPTLADVGLTQPPDNVADAPVSKTSEDLDSLRVGSVDVERESPTAVEIRLSARYKPEDMDSDDEETDQWGYIETEPLPALRITNLDKHEADLIEAFVPVAVDKAGGFANFRETATKTNSLVDRLRKLTLPRIEEVGDGLESYIETKERAEELDRKIERTDDLIDEIVYDLYGLTEEEVEIVENAVE
jgi:hypothetical protein